MVENLNFMLIGAGKSGTSSISFYLNQHPEIFISTPKELNYFAFTQEDLSQYSSKDQMWIKNSITSYKEYSSKFSAATLEKAIGEASGIYLFHPRAAQRIWQQFPGIKLIAILRNPVQRAYSGYQMQLRKGLEKRSFIDAIKQDSASNKLSFLTGCYLEKGLYFKQLTRYYKLFPRDQIKIFQYEQLIEKPVKLMQSIYSFLGVNPEFVPDIKKRVNVAPSYTQPLLQEDKEYLLKAYREDINKLENLINRDLSSWLV